MWTPIPDDEVVGNAQRNRDFRDVSLKLAAMNEMFGEVEYKSNLAIIEVLKFFDGIKSQDFFMSAEIAQRCGIPSGDAKEDILPLIWKDSDKVEMLSKLKESLMFWKAELTKTIESAKESAESIRKSVKSKDDSTFDGIEMFLSEKVDSITKQIGICDSYYDALSEVERKNQFVKAIINAGGVQETLDAARAAVDDLNKQNAEQNDGENDSDGYSPEDAERSRAMVEAIRRMLSGDK